ncbi:MAG: bifunctional heptose 7-phosphate kinase/heptose 1-phosphate adenyltransferase [Terriglobales bacterium]
MPRCALALKSLSLFPQLNLVVWGDLVADEFVDGEIARVSREAPVLILKQRGRKLAAGGGANAALNLAALGVHVRLVGAVGADPPGRGLLQLFRKAGVATSGIAVVRGRATPTKTRILAHHAHTAPQQVVRLDQEPPPLSAGVQARLARSARRALRGAQGLLVSDYGYASVSPALAAAARAPLSSVDARFQIAAYHGMTAATPNEPELESALNCQISAHPDPPAALERAGRTLLRRLRCRHLLITRGRHGLALFEPGRRTLHLPVFGSQQALDVTGAGDTVIAVFTAALAAGADGPAAALLANCAGGLVVMKPGTATVSASELRAALESLP